MEESEQLAACRAAIDSVDDQLAILLEERARLTARVQRLKVGAGQTTRDPRRESEIVERMARRAPDLGPARLRRIMSSVIEAGLDLAAERRQP